MKTFKELREAMYGYKMASPKAKKEDAATDKAVKDFLAKGGKIKKLAPGKAAGYHGKDDPGKGMAGMMDRGDTKELPRKKVKSMESAEVKEISKKTLGSYIKKATADVDNKSYVQGKVDQGFQDYKKDHNVKLNQRRRGIDKAVDKLTKEDDDTARMYKDNPEMMKKGGPGGYKGLNKAGKKNVKKAMNTELTYDTMNKYYDKAKKSLHRAKNSHDANIMRKTDPSKDKATIDKRVKGIKLAKTRSIKKIRGDK